MGNGFRDQEVYLQINVIPVIGLPLKNFGWEARSEGQRFSHFYGDFLVVVLGSGSSNY